jgi:RNA polymerase sigma-B factor
MGIDCLTVGDVEVVRVRGPLDRSSADGLRAAAAAALLRADSTVVMNLAGVPRIDAAGLGVLAEIHRIATGVGRRLALTDVQPRVRELLDATELSAAIEIGASEWEAVEDGDRCALN